MAVLTRYNINSSGIVLFIVYFFTCVGISSNEAARILAVFPAPSISHQVVFRPLTQALAKRGHELVVITPDPVFTKGKYPTNFTEIDVHDMSYGIWQENLLKISKGQKDFITQMTYLLELLTQIQAKYFETEEINKLISDPNKKFDLLLIEAVAKPALIFSHIYKVPVITISSLGAIFDNYEVIGAPTHPILYPAITSRRLNNLSVWEKISEIYQKFQLSLLLMRHEQIENAMLKKYLGDDVPTLSELSNNVDMLFLNCHPIFEGIRPVPQSVVHMGGIHQNPEKELPKDLKSYLDASKNGVIYLSFGTNVVPSMLPREKIESIIKVFSELPHNVLWKYDQDVLPGKTDNIKIGKWFPQSDLLRHPNIKLFITQAGLQSTDEAITAGVPLIAIPALGDQWFNAERYEYHKIGIRLDMEALTYDSLKSAIKTILGNDSYRRNIVHLRELIQDQPMKPLERAVWWVEYVLRHGGAKHLRSPAANITWAEYLEIKILLILVSGLLICFSLVTICFIYLFKIISSLFVTKNVNNKKKKK